MYIYLYTIYNEEKRKKREKKKAEFSRGFREGRNHHTPTRRQLRATRLALSLAGRGALSRPLKFIHPYTSR